MLKYHENGGVSFTTGDTEEKLLTHFNNYLTTFENLSSNKKMTGVQHYNAFKDQSMLDILDISSILGSSFDKKAIILDEFQSCDLRTARSCLTRISDNCKLIVCGDILQQTMTNLGKEDSALFASIEWLKEVEGVGHISLKNIHRGKIVDDVAKAFDKKMYG